MTAEITRRGEEVGRCGRFNTMQSNVLSCCFPQLILNLGRGDLGGGVTSNPRTVVGPPVTFIIAIIIMIMITI